MNTILLIQQKSKAFLELSLTQGDYLNRSVYFLLVTLEK